MRTTYKFLLLALLIMIYTSLCVGQINNTVGTLSGIIDVSQTAAAVYKVPIQAVPGTMGMEPNISVVYNSQSGIGVLGSNWQLEGLSSIRRIPQNFYHDNNITNVNLDLRDRYTLDGNRLIVENGVYGANETSYKTEIETYRDITSLGSLNGSGPDYFVVVDDNGTVYEYGRTLDSKQMLGTVPLAWYVNKITDCEDNYITFTYSQNFGQIVISEINYSGNDKAAKSPYAKMIFKYNDNNLKNTSYIRGQGYVRSKLLDEISTYYQGSLVRKYNFIYDYTRLARLNQITLTGENNMQLNPTIIDWGESVNDTSSYTCTDYEGTGYVPFRYDDDKCIDFYFWTTDPNSGTQGKKLNLVFNDCKGNLSIGYNQYNVNYYSSSFPADVTGDGLDEIVYAQNDAGGMVSYHYLYLIPNPPYVENKHLNHSFVKTSLAQVLAGDLNGDGKDEIIFYTPTVNPKVTLWGLNDGVTHTEFNSLYGQAIRVQDNNGNRKAEIMIDFMPTTEIYEYDNTDKKFKNIVGDPNSVLGNNYDYYGDFNDDGLRDVLLISRSGSGNNHSCKVLINVNGVDRMWSSSATTIPLELTFNSQTNQLTSPPFIGDMNGDKKDDIVTIVKQTDAKIRVDVFYTDGYVNGTYLYHKVSYIVNNFTLPNLIDQRDYYCTDMNGDGCADILSNRTPIIKTTLFFHKDSQFELMQNVTDGYGAKASIRYVMSYSPSNYYTANFESRTYIPKVTDVFTSNGLGIGMNQTKYEFYNALYSYKRNQFWGFDLVETINVANGLKNTIKYKMNPDFDHVDLVERTIYQSGSILQEKFTPKYINWGKRFLSYSEISTKLDYLTGVKTTTTSLVDFDGRIYNEQIRNCRISNANSLSTSIIEYQYQWIVMPNYRTAVKLYSLNETENILGSVESLHYSTVYNYLDGRLNTVVNSNDSRIITTTYAEYNPFGRPESITKSSANVESQTETSDYDETGRFVTSLTNALGQTSISDYYYHTGNIKTTTDINGLITSYYYDEFGRDKLRVNPDGTSVIISRQWATPLPWFPEVVYTVTTDATATPKKIVYLDKLNREIFSYIEGMGHKQTVYNAKGQIDKESYPYNVPNLPDARKIWTNYLYDPQGRIDIETGPYTNRKYTYDPGLNADRYFITVTDRLRNTNVTKWYDLPGRIAKAQDPGGIVSYNYEYKKVDNKLCKVQTNTYSNNTLTLVSDLDDNLTSFVDPNSGTITSTYDGFNRLTSKTDANGNQTTCQYDKLDRLILEKHNGSDEPERVFVFKFDEAPGQAKGKLYYKSINGELDEMYLYDNLSRVKTRRKIVDKALYSELFEYNALGQLYQYTYPDNFRIRYSYNTFGELSSIFNDTDNTLICDITRNNFRKHASCVFGNKTGISYLYNVYGMLTNISSGNLNTGLPSSEKESGEGTNDPFTTSYAIGDEYRALQYTYNTKGLIERREDTRIKQYESYIYDNMDRLTNYTSGTTTPLTVKNVVVGINPNGNIISSTGVGTYIYDPVRSYAVANILPNPDCPISQATCEVKYNNLNLPLRIEEGLYSYTIDYDSDGKRRSAKLVKTENNVPALLKTTRYISPSCEIEITPEGTKYIDYIHTDQGVAAIRTKTGTQQQMYYVHTDHLGSYNFVMDADKNIVQSCHFDPWGNRKQYYNWSVDNTAPAFLFSRGYTSHEHLDVFKIINMNARLYDPVIGRFFSPDPVIQDFSSSQSLNRYSYCLNNPIMNVDPDGRMVDDYFNEYGDYLYTDTQSSDKIRIMKQKVWDRIKIEYTSELLDISHSHRHLIDELTKNSTLLADVDYIKMRMTSNILFTNILNHYYEEAGYSLDELSIPVLNGNSPIHSIWATTMGDLAVFMYPNQGWPIPANYEIPKGYIGIAVAIADLANGTMNSRSDVINMFRHERGGHGNQYFKGIPFLEREATLTQVRDLSWINSSNEWKQHIYKIYGKYRLTPQEQKKYFGNFGIK